jgi:hypothetical protein
MRSKGKSGRRTRHVCGEIPHLARDLGLRTAPELVLPQRFPLVSLGELRCELREAGTELSLVQIIQPFQQPPLQLAAQRSPLHLEVLRRSHPGIERDPLDQR